MALKKEEGADLRKRYPIYAEVGMIVALLLLILAFRWDWGSGPKKTFDMSEQETVDLKEVKQTQQKKKPPPPPRPPVPIERPDDEVLEDDNLDFDATLNLEETLTEQEPTPMPEQPKQEEKDEVVPFAVIEDKPKLKGGQEWIYDNIEYPRFAKRANIEGTVYLQFVVDKQGNVRELTVLRSPNEVLSKEAMRVMRQAKFEPGRQRKKPVEVRMSQPVKFKLQ